MSATDIQAIARAQRAEARIRTLTEALRFYGRHREYCNGYPAGSAEEVAERCDCGFAAICPEGHA